MTTVTTIAITPMTDIYGDYLQFTFIYNGNTIIVDEYINDLLTYGNHQVIVTSDLSKVSYGEYIIFDINGVD